MNKDGWENFPIHKDKTVVTSKWVYTIKLVVDGRIDKYKARFVAKGFSQQEGINYEETYAPTVMPLDHSFLLWLLWDEGLLIISCFKQ